VLDTPPDLSGRKTLSKAEAAATLGLSVDSFEQHVMPHLRIVQAGARILIPAAEIDRYVEAQSARALKGGR
jgi:hypothetical protein